MVPRDVWAIYDREFCSSSCNLKTKQHKVMKFCKSVDIYNVTRLHIFISG